MKRALLPLLATLIAAAPFAASAAEAPAAKAAVARKAEPKAAKADPTDDLAKAEPAKVEDTTALAALKPAAAAQPDAVKPIATTVAAGTDAPAPEPLSTTTASPAAGKATAAPADRIEAAKLAVWKRLFDENVPAEMAAKGQYLTVHPTSSDFGGSVHNPVTGVGPIVTSVRQTYATKSKQSQALSRLAWAEARQYAKKLGVEDKIPAHAGEEAPERNPSFLARVANDHFSKYGNRTFVVDVDQNGNGDTQGMGTIDSVKSNNFQAKLRTLLANVKAVFTPQLMKDVATATQPKQIATVVASVTGVAGSIATANPIAMIAAASAAAVAVQSVTSDIVKDVQAAVATRNQAQTTALTGAAKWAQATLTTSDPATSVEAYREYKSQLATALPGTQPWSFEKFVGQLQLQHL